MKNLITCLVVCILSGATFATTWTVDDDGKADFDNIQAAVDAASTGDFIQVFPGIYNESVQVWDKVLTIEKFDTGDVGEVVLDGTGLETQALIYVSPNNHGTIIKGITFQNSPNKGIWIDNCDNSSIINCVVQNNFGGGINCYPGANSLIKGCNINNNTGANAIGIKYGKIDSCFITDNSQGSGGSYGGAIRIDSGNMDIVNCLIANNSFGGGGGVSMYGGFAHIVNCTLVGNSCAAFRPYNGSMAIENSIVWGNNQLTCGGENMAMSFSCVQESWPGEGNHSVDPLFKNMMYYTVSEGSICINSGSDLAAQDAGLIFDISGNPRYLGESVDIGAWEFQSNVIDQDGDGIPDKLDNCYLYNPKQLDCNENDVGDVCDIADGTSTDWDGNEIPDDCECLADVNADGNVNVNDILILIGNWGSGSNIGDINFDGIVNVTDLLYVISNWGPCE